VFSKKMSMIRSASISNLNKIVIVNYCYYVDIFKLIVLLRTACGIHNIGDCKNLLIFVVKII